MTKDKPRVRIRNGRVLGEVVSHKYPTNQKLVAHIKEHILTPAERGEICGVFYVNLWPDFSAGRGWSSDRRGYAVVGALEMLKKDLLENLS